MSGRPESGASATRLLVAGIGNVLRGDDGFGPAVVQALEADGGLPAGVHTVEVGIGGLGLIHELMNGFDALVIADAAHRGGAPGTLYLLEAEVPGVETFSEVELGSLALGMHDVVPGNVLLVARALGILPPVVRILGCEPAETEEFSTDLTPTVRRVVPEATRMIREFAALLGAGEGGERVRS